MPRFGQGFTIQQILFVEIDLGQIVFPHLHFDATRGTRRVPSTIVIELKPECLGCLQQCEIGLDLSAPTLGM